MARVTDDIKRLQRNARAKDRRLLNKGASRENIYGDSGVSPVKPMGEVKKMTSAELKSYKRDLKFYTQMSSHTVYDNGLVLSSIESAQVTSRLTSYNKEASKMINKVKAFVTDPSRLTTSGEQFGEEYGWPEERAQIRSGGIHAGKTLASGTTNATTNKLDIKNMELPTTREGMKDRLARWERQGFGTPVMTGARRNADRVSTYKMLYIMGDPDLAETVLHLSDDQFDILITNTPLFDELIVEYDPYSVPNYVSDMRNKTISELRAYNMVQSTSMGGRLFGIREYVDDLLNAFPSSEFGSKTDEELEVLNR